MNEREQGFWKLQRAFNYLLADRHVDVPSLWQITRAQRDVLGFMRWPEQIAMFELLAHRNELESSRSDRNRMWQR